MPLEHEQNYGLGMDAAGACMLLEHEQNYGSGMDAAGARKLLEHERNCGLGMDALVTAFPWNTNGIMFWAWMPLVTACSWNTNGTMIWASLYSARRGLGGLNPEVRVWAAWGYEYPGPLITYIHPYMTP